MVRLGIGLYGVSPIDTPCGLETVSTLKTTILQIKTLSAGETIGYGRKGVLSRDSRIAAIPIGYADGLDRHLGNGIGCVVVNGKRAENYFATNLEDAANALGTSADTKDKNTAYGRLAAANAQLEDANKMEDLVAFLQTKL